MTTRPSTALAFAAAVGLPVLAAAGETITVDTVDDVTDFGGLQQVADLPGPDGRVSFREACTAASNTPGPQTVAFAIPASEWWLFDDRALLRLEDGAFVVSGDETTLDFTTQTAFTGDTNPDGWEVGIYGLQPNGWGVAAMFVTGDDCVIKGLDRVMQRGYGVEIRGHGNRVVSCTISGAIHAAVKVQGDVGAPALDNTIGGTGPGEGNVLSGGSAGVRIDGPVDGTVVIGNTLIGSPAAGVEVRGAYCCPDYTPYNTRIGGPTPAEANWIADNGSYGEEGFPFGDQVTVEWAVGTLVEGNVIGTTADGSARYPAAAGTAGVSVRESDDTVIRGNLISGIRKEGVNHHSGEVFGSGVAIWGPNTGVVVHGNRIGTDAAGTGAVPNLHGITFTGFQGFPSGGAIGGAGPDDGNIVAFNERTGIAVVDGVSGVAIRRNAIFANGLLGIDLLGASGQTGPTPNDPDDDDAGANGLQNYPVIETAAADGAAITVTGTLASVADASFTLDLFASGTCDASGFGEGATYLGTTTVVTDGGGAATFDVGFAASVPAGHVVTATATRDATGDTSELSACATVTGGAKTGDVDGDGAVTFADLLAVLGAWGPCPAPPAACAADLDGDGLVGFADLLVVLGSWG